MVILLIWFLLGLNLNALRVEDLFVSDYMRIIFEAVFNDDIHSIKHTTCYRTLYRQLSICQP